MTRNLNGLNGYGQRCHCPSCETEPAGQQEAPRIVKAMSFAVAMGITILLFLTVCWGILWAIMGILDLLFGRG